MYFRASILDRTKTGGTARNSLDGSWRSYVPEDDNGNLTDLHYKKQDGSTVQRFQYEYDKNSMRTAMVDNDGRHDYTYDAIYQITQATHPTAPNPLERFSYDAAGNRLTDLTHSAYQYNELNQLTEDDSCVYAYDLDGNMISKVSKETGDSTVFTYDIENRLILLRKSGMITRYIYNARGHRMRKEVNGVVKQYRYDGENLIIELNGVDSIIANYTFGPGVDNPLLMCRLGMDYYYLKDGLGSVSALTDSNELYKIIYNYSLFGEIKDDVDTSENPFKYCGREFDREAGLYYYRSRYYNYNSGRFIQSDPIGFESGDLNFYRYVGNNPVRYTDAFGMKWSTSDFVNHYFSGKGAGVDLGSVGLLGDVQGATSNDVNNLKSQVSGLIHASAISICKRGSSSGAVSGNRKTSVDLTSTIFVVGHSTLGMRYKCNISCNKQCNKTYSFSCRVLFSINDAFKDPLDLGNWIKPDIEIPGGTPYSITASWADKLSGSGSY